MTVVCTSDKQYYPLLKVLIKSIACNSPNVHVVVRLVNCDHSCETDLQQIYQNVEVIFDNKELCTKRKKLQRSGAPLQDEMFNVYKPCNNENRFRGAKWLYSEKMAYCSNIKYNTINMLFERGIENILYMDADAIVRKSLDGLITISDKYDISMFIETDKGIYSGVIDPSSLPTTDYYDRQDSTTWVEWNAGLFTVRNNAKMKRFFHELEEAINDPAELYDWEADQVLFNEQYQKVKNDITVYSLPQKFKDEEFSDSSNIWCGAGEHKFQTEKFIKEQELYMS